MKKPTSIYEILQPMYIISKILGLAPFKLKNKQLTPHYGPILPLKILIIVGGMCYIAVSVEGSKDITGIAAFALKCELYLGTFMTFTVLMLSAFSQKSLINIIKELVNIDEYMKRIHIGLEYKNCKKFGITQSIVITSIFMLKVTLQYFSYTTEILAIYSAFNFIDYMNTIMLFQYIDLLLLIRQRFICLNRRLKNASKYSHPIYFNKSKISTIPILTITTGKLSMVKKIEIDILLSNLAKIYNKLCNVSRLVNRTYNIQILITVGSRFVMITTQLINTYYTIRNPSKGSVTRYIVLSIYMGLHLSKIFMIASVSESTSSKAKQTGIYLHHIWELIPEFQDDIKYFSMQILHQNLKFTGCGFFMLDNTLIYSIVGAVATYFVIAIQLEKTF